MLKPSTTNYKAITISLIVLFLLTSCASNRYLKEREEAMGTTGKYKWSFHRLSDRDKGVTLAFPGYVIGLEKAKRDLIGAPSKDSIRNHGALKVFGFKDTEADWQNLPYLKRRVLDDPRATFVSSIVQYQLNDAIVPHMEPTMHYNAYDLEFLSDTKDAFTTGFDQLDAIGDQILKDIKQQNITHVFLVSMGWNADQMEALRNFNSLFLKLLDQAKNTEKDFRPLFVGYTWASKWNDGITNAVSLFNKSNDADEIGMTWFNYLLNKKILADKTDNSYKTILLGHSLGAKLTSRATMSASMLDTDSRKVDLLINLESAYSINRFSKNKGVEATDDYVNWDKYVDKIALIWSRYDSATTTAIWAPYAGGRKGERRVRKHPEYYPGIERLIYDTNTGVAFSQDQQLLLIDASSIIYRDAYFKSGGAHSDIYNPEVAKILWELIVSSTFD